MRRKLLPLAIFTAALTAGAIRAHAQTDIKPRYFRLDITITGKASCFWDGSDCKVG
jgi:hypothetical protein